jgi:hypothetical protein
MEFAMNEKWLVWMTHLNVGTVLALALWALYVNGLFWMA